MNKRVRLIVIASIAIFIPIAFVIHKLSVNRVKTSVVVGTYNSMSIDGCGGLILKNKDRIDTSCFWGNPDNRTEPTDGIKVGDTVEYGVKSGKRFVRLKQH